MEIESSSFYNPSLAPLGKAPDTQVPGTMWILDREDYRGNRDSYVHEAGHWIEDYSSRIQTMSVKLQESRRLHNQGRYYDKYVDRNYGSNDDTGDFTAMIGPGRECTEVLSVGMAAMAHDPYGLAIRDPELFNFVLYALQPQASARREAGRGTAATRAIATRRTVRRLVLWVTRGATERGGEGSGNFGHKGRPGQKGGSAPGGGKLMKPRKPKTPKAEATLEPPPPPPEPPPAPEPEPGPTVAGPIINLAYMTPPPAPPPDPMYYPPMGAPGVPVRSDPAAIEPL